MRVSKILSIKCPLLFGLMAASLAFPLVAADKQPLTGDEIRKITAAAPEKATASPQKPRKLLVFTLVNGYYHSSIPHGAKAVEVMGQKTGAYQATVSEDISWFEPEKLSQFDGVCFVNALGEIFLPPDFDKLPAADQAKLKERDQRLKRSLADFVLGGKGLSGIHGPSFLFLSWPEFGQILGAVFDNHPWNSTDKLALKIDEPNHPVTQAFQGVGFEIIDEGYQFKEPYSRKTSRVLLSLDLTRTAMPKEGIHRTDGDFGITWVKPAGKGRVFYCALGHNPEEYWNPQLLRHYLDGIQFSLGDLKGEIAPLPAKR